MSNLLERPKSDSDKPVVIKQAAAKKPEFFAVFEEASVQYVSFQDADNTRLRAFVQSTLRGVIGGSATAQYNNVYPVTFLARHIPAFQERINNYGFDEDDRMFVDLFNLLNSALNEVRAEMKERLDAGKVEASDIPILFPEGSEIAVMMDNGWCGGIVKGIELQTSFFGSYYIVKLQVIHNLNGKPEEGLLRHQMSFWKGLQDVNELSVLRMTPELKEKLTKRGRTFAKIVKGATYMVYAGSMTRSPYWSSRSYRADGRVMVDPASFQRVDSDGYNNQVRSAHIDTNRNDTTVGFVLEENDLWQTVPFTLGFSFRTKKWGQISVEGLSEINWRDDGFDKLVMPAEEKHLVRALVEHHGGSFSDIVDGKGGGCIFLLHGEPGQGKTLTAETVAELLHKPLYAISVGELGTDPESLEEKLVEILDITTSWDAVLLLDEADIFLEERDEKDIVRNAMVGVFLRLLEYHQGVLFLTTNRVRNIDSAFYSRISVGLAFAGSDQDKREKIWINLLDSAGVSGLDTRELSAFELNGRQIKNTIRLAQTLARAEKVPVTMAHMERTIKIANKFRHQIQS